LIPILLWKINYSTCMYIVQYCINGLVFCWRNGISHSLI
jgi:hypothetical protein